MLGNILQATIPEVTFERPAIDWHAVSPELILLGWGALVTLFDIVFLEKARRFIPTLTGIGFLVAMVPLITLWNSSENLPCLLYTSPSPRDRQKSRMPSSA